MSCAGMTTPSDDPSDDAGRAGGVLEGWGEETPQGDGVHTSPEGDDASESCAYAFEEREERIKEQLLEIEEQSTVSDAWAYAVIGLEDDDERREREHRELWEMCEREEREQELRQVHEIYKRASNRVFRRLKNLPEPPPGCHYTGDGEDDTEDYGVQDISLQTCDPGEGEDTTDDGDPNSPQATGFQDVLVHKPSAQPARPSHRSVLKRLRRRRQHPKPVPPPLPSCPIAPQSSSHSAPTDSGAAESSPIISPPPQPFEPPLPQPILAGT